MDLERIRDFITLDQEKKVLEAQLQILKQQIADLQPGLKDDFAREGVNSINLDGVTVYLHRALWARPAQGQTTQQLADALKSCGLQDFVHETCNLNTLSAYLRELERNGQPMPEDLVGILNLEEVFTVRATKG